MPQIIRILASIAFLLLLSFSVQAQEAPLQIAGAKTINCQDAIELMASLPDVVIVDTRTREDFERGHIEGAIAILDTDMTAESLAVAVKSKSTPVIFYCNGLKCGRAAHATQKALTWGYTAVFYYAEGTRDWVANQLPLVTN